MGRYPGLGLVVGGCCRDSAGSCYFHFPHGPHPLSCTDFSTSNALTLERVPSEYPKSGSLITFSQFLPISLHGLPKFIEFTRGPLRFPISCLRPRRSPVPHVIPHSSYPILLCFLNNLAFGYNIPMPVHIIFRSCGLVVSMLTVGCCPVIPEYRLPSSSHKGAISPLTIINLAVVKYMQNRTCAKSSKVTSHLAQNLLLARENICKGSVKCNDFLMLEQNEPLPMPKPEGKKTPHKKGPNRRFLDMTYSILIRLPFRPTPKFGTT